MHWSFQSSCCFVSYVQHFITIPAYITYCWSSICVGIICSSSPVCPRICGSMCRKTRKHMRKQLITVGNCMLSLFITNIAKKRLLVKVMMWSAHMRRRFMTNGHWLRNLTLTPWEMLLITKPEYEKDGTLRCLPPSICLQWLLWWVVIAWSQNHKKQFWVIWVYSWYQIFWDIWVFCRFWFDKWSKFARSFQFGFCFFIFSSVKVS